MKFFLALVLAAVAACSAAEEDGGKQWALLVAGSSGFSNYRHQADIAHAYKILIRRGVPADNIVVLLYDDVANNPLNPQKGVLINRPDGEDVYKGLKIDYKGDDVTPQNFLNVLSGNKDALKGIGTGRVIESGPKDNVFVNFADHGGPGLLGFPNDLLSASDLITTLKKLGDDNKFAKLVLYVEACNAGSMFESLIPEHTKILVSTASAPDESSWGVYCDYKNYPCLGDLYSINWMELVDKKLAPNENLFDQYQAVRAKTGRSHVQLYGDYSVGSSEASSLLGEKNLPSQADSEEDINSESLVISRDVALYFLERMSKDAKSKALRHKYAAQLEELLKNRKFVDKTVRHIIEKVSIKDEDLVHKVESEHLPLAKHILESYTRVYSHFIDRCFKLSKNQYILNHFYKFVNLCHLGYEEEVMEAIDTECGGDNFPILINTE